MLAMEFVESPESREPAPAIAAAVREAALQSGLILLQAGVHSNCIRVLVSLVATDEQVDEALDILAGGRCRQLRAELARSPQRRTL